MSESGISRRDFIVKSTAAAAGLAAFDHVATAGEGAATPPAPAPALPSPPPRELLVARMDQTRAMLKEAKAMGLVEVCGPNLLYLTGLPLAPRERMSSLIVPAEGPSKLVCSILDKVTVESRPGAVDEVIYWEEYDDPIGILVKLLKKSDLTKGTLAMASRIDYNDFVEVNREMPKLEFISTTPIVGYQRERKSIAEIELIEAATAIVSRAIERSYPAIREGMREFDLEAIILADVRESGADGGGVVRFGPRTADPAGVTTDRKLASGDAILIDFEARVHGYHARLIRTVVLGKATGRMKMIYSLNRKAQELAFDRAKPDAMCAAIDQIALATVGGSGFVSGLLHRLGSGIGLESEEPPWLSKGYNVRLAQGNVVVMSPGVYTAGEYGIRGGDLAVITGTGARWLSTPPVELPEL